MFELVPGSLWFTVMSKDRPTIFQNKRSTRRVGERDEGFGLGCAYWYFSNNFSDLLAEKAEEAVRENRQIGLI